MAEKKSKISLLINNTAGQNITGDKTVELLSPQMNEVWFDTDYQPHTYEPLKKGMVRINYYRSVNYFFKITDAKLVKIILSLYAGSTFFIPKSRRYISGRLPQGLRLW